MSKGYFLNKWFLYADKVQAQMDNLFKVYNVPYLELMELPNEARAVWYDLKKKRDRITDNITNLILKK